MSQTVEANCGSRVVSGPLRGSVRITGSDINQNAVSCSRIVTKNIFLIELLVLNYEFVCSYIRHAVSML